MECDLSLCCAETQAGDSNVECLPDRSSFPHWHCPLWLTHTSQSQLVWSFESQSRVKVKVVKWCRKKWFDHNQMYIYHKQCEILQKNHRNSSNIQFQWFPIEKGRKLCKRKRWNGWSKSIVLENKVVINFDFRSGAKKSGHLDYPLQSYGPKVITPPKKRRNKKKTRLQFCVLSFHIESAWSH